MLVQGSANADVTAELVWVGEGAPKDLEGLDVKGKIVVTSGPASSVHNIGLSAEWEPKASSHFIPRGRSSTRSSCPGAGSAGEGQSAKFAFCLPPREGEILRDRLRRGEKITVHAKVEAASEKYELQDVVATIPGTDRDADEIILTAHLFEGFVNAGCQRQLFRAARRSLEMARTLQTLIADGRLPARSGRSGSSGRPNSPGRRPMSRPSKT